MSGVSQGAGGYVVEAALLGSAFGIEPALVPEMMQSGAITGHHEKGVGADEGRQCLVFSHSGRTFRITLDAEGRIVSQALFRPLISRDGGKA